MKWYQILLFGLNSLAGFYLLYMAAMHFFVYFANITMGQDESLLPPIRNLVPGVTMTGLTLCAWIFLKDNPVSQTGNILLLIPFIFALLFALWTVVLLRVANRKWN